MTKPVDALFIGAHADDIELCCGGTLAKIVRSGKSAGIVELTRGEMGTRGTAEIRLRESLDAAKILGASFREQLDFGDGGLRTGRAEELQLMEVIRQCRPQILFAPWIEERHPDHARAGRLVIEAAFYAGLRKIETKHEAHRPQAVLHFIQWHVPAVTFVVDVTETWQTRMDAVAAYKSQFFDPNSSAPRTKIAERQFLEMIEARGIHFGSLIGAHYGEAFVTAQPPKVNDIFAAYGGREV
ncbi:MAG TPA: bacillithiol biosynthesis deacetylase BshB1 [Thermoanaerobaculia bacterium]|nr:bacillithiol biosynthesis deacetylase BshB1 [Thermoanaerobaculia bacterium]